VQYNVPLLVFGTGKDQVAKTTKEIMINRPTDFNYIPQNKIVCWKTEWLIAVKFFLETDNKIIYKL
jgi:hypothetical protein